MFDGNRVVRQKCTRLHDFNLAFYLGRVPDGELTRPRLDMRDPEAFHGLGFRIKQVEHR